MKKIVLAAAAAAIGLTGLVAPSAQAAQSAPMTYAQLQTDPTFVAYATNAENQYQKGSFQVLGSVTSLDGTILQLENFAYDGQVLRNQWGPSGASNTKRTTINYINVNKEQTCTRHPSTMKWGNIDGDKNATWKCKKGVDQGSLGELYIQTPMHKAEYLNSRIPGVTFTYEIDSIDPTRMKMLAYGPDGALLYTMDYTARGSGDNWFSTKSLNHKEGREVYYFVSALDKSYDPIPWKKLKKKW